MATHRSRERSQQNEFEFQRRGGRRKGAGRKPKGERPGVPHTKRPPVSRHCPSHVTLRLHPALPSLRRPSSFNAVLCAFLPARERLGLRLVHFSVQSNHIHLIVEARDRAAQTRGLRGLAVRIARSLNRTWERRGPVFADRPHERALRTPWEVRNALIYVLHNAHRHGIHQPGVDPCSSGSWFDGWRGVTFDVRGRVCPVARPRSWLLRVGWRWHGEIGIDELPALPRRRSMAS